MQSAFIVTVCGFSTLLINARHRSKRKKLEVYGNGTIVLRCGTRKSALAMIQTRWTASTLVASDPCLLITILDGVDTMADKTLNVSLKELVQKEVKDVKKPSPGLFTKELEAGLENDRYDFVVHSLKDVPTTLPPGLVIAAICKREDPRDCVVFRKGSNVKTLRDLPVGSIVGTSSVRREALLKRDYPGLKIKLIRGNVNTRLAKLDAGEFDAILLAMAGLRRLGFHDRIGQALNPDEFPYGVSQGSLGIQCREKDEQIHRILKSIGDPESTYRCLGERALLRELEGGCQVPLGVTTRVFYSKAKEELMLEISSQILSLDGRCTVSGQLQGPAKECESLGVRLAVMLREQAGGIHLIRADDSWADHQVISKPTNKRPITYGDAENPNRG